METTSEKFAPSIKKTPIAITLGELAEGAKEPYRVTIETQNPEIFEELFKHHLKMFNKQKTKVV